MDDASISNGEMILPWVASDEFGHGLGEIDGLDEPGSYGLADEERIDEEPADDESSGSDILRALALNMREAADVLSRIAHGDANLPNDLLIASEVVFYTHSAEEFKTIVRLLGGKREKSGSGDSFWIKRKFGSGESEVSISVYAPTRSAVCEKKIVRYEQVEVEEYVKTGEVESRPVFEWDCGSILGEEAA